MPLPSDFADTGFFATRAADTPITRYQVLGERSSGTNFVKRLIGRNTRLKPTEVLGWKHGFAHMMAVPQNMAVICVVRAADTWTRSMFDKPWHTTPQMQALPFGDFIRAPWDTHIDRPRYFEGLIANGSSGAILQQDRDPATGARFDTLFALRTAKLKSLLSMTNRDCTCLVLRMEHAQTAPEAALSQICETLAVQPNETYRPVVKRLGSKFKAAIPQRHPRPETWSPEDLSHLRSSLDADLEASLGYSY